MKKAISVILVLSLCLLFAACSESEVVPTETTNPVTEGSQATEPSVTEPTNGEDVTINQKPLVSVYLPTQTDEELAENGTVLLTYTYQYMSLTMTDAEVKDKITIDFLNKIDQTQATANGVLASAKDAYNGSADWAPYQYSITYQPTRIDNGVLSLLGSDARYYGAHVEVIFNSINYSMVTGNALSLYNIIKDQTQAQDLCDAVIEKLTESEVELNLYPDFATTVEQHFSGGANDAWYFSANGLCFFFSPYEIAPYSSGVVSAEIPYEDLSDILREEYFPEERDPVYGTIELLEFNVENQQKFTQFSELVIDEGAGKFLLFTNKAAYDIQIDIINRTSSGALKHKQTVYAASSLTPGDAIMVDADLTNGNSLQIRYLSGDTNTESSVLIYASPETGELIVAEQK